MKGIRASKGLLFILLLCLLWFPHYCDIKENAADSQGIETDKVISSDSSRVENVPSEQEKKITVEDLENIETIDVQPNVEYVNSAVVQDINVDTSIVSSLQEDRSLEENDKSSSDQTSKQTNSIELKEQESLITKRSSEIPSNSPDLTSELVGVAQGTVSPSLDPSSLDPTLPKQTVEKKRPTGPSLHSAAVEALARSTAPRTEEAARPPHHIPRRPAAEKTASEDSQHHQPHYDGMPSFDEWKKMMLAEQEKGGQKVPVPTVPGKKISSQKRRRNYSSFECGAKIVASNAESEGTGRILNELVDEYMLNPCKAKIWFVIELCETVQATQIELANFELFSSCPRDFAVYSSDNFPTRDWVKLGTFTAAELRLLQSFELKQEGFGKFIKIELLSYYGKEHYCPLSVVRIFGTSMVDEYEEMETMSSHPEISDDDLDRLDIVLEDKKSTNLFGTATDAVMNIMKKAAQALGQHQTLELDSKSNETFPEPQNASKTKVCKVVNNSFEVCEEVGASDKTTSPALHNFSSLPTSTLHSLFRLVRHCDSCVSSRRIRYHSSAQPHCRFFQAAFGPVVFQSLCDWFREHPLVFAYETPTHGRNEPPLQRDDPSSQTPKSPPPQIILFPLENDPVKKALNASTVPSEEHVEIVAINSTRVVSEHDDSSLQLETIQPTPSQQVIRTVVLNESQLAIPDVQSEDSSLSSVDLTKELTPTPLISMADESNLSVVDIVLDPPLPMVDVDVPGGDVFSEADEDQMTDFLLEPTTVVPEDLTLSEGLRVSEVDARNEMQGKLEPVTVAGASTTGQKESVFMRMSNRIKALELNMSLSSQYLQELSQRYRRQMEEMQRAFNRTIGTLNDTAKKAAEKDVKQQEILNTLQLQVANLSESMEFLLNERTSVFRQMVETHVFLMIIEAIIMVTVMSLCVRRLSSGGVRAVSVDRQAVLSSPRLSKRRSSVDGCSSPVARKVQKRSASEEPLNPEDELLIVEPLPVSIDPILKAKKKNRKRSKVQRSISNPSVQRRNSSSPTSQRADKRVSYSEGCILKQNKFNSQLQQQRSHACENCNDNNACAGVKTSDKDRKPNGTPFQNLTNGTVASLHQHSMKNSKIDKEKFSFKKFLRLQKRDSI